MSETENFVAFITKYALSNGIEQARVERSKNFPSIVSPVGNRFLNLHGEGKEWHRTAESAIARAEQMRADKITSLKKQIAKLEKLSFAP